MSESGENRYRATLKELPKINLTQTQAFGDTSGVMFDRMGLVDVDDNNSVYISERAMGNRTVHVFSEDGSY
ncbi:MAG: hypothetical protein U5J63_04500 [Fodinibius sp.]|nr:hypothetical protein [Fodinibius sp.]